jgi:predicted 2-oxoglutarate/Fe(II)-dependent dioxygenase YbiX
MTERIGNSFEDKHAAPYEKMILDAFHKTTKIYLEEHNIKLNNYFFPNFDIARYYKGGSMNYHTDYPQEKYFIPEHKFFTTVIMYLNDNYDGGVLSFIEVDENKEILWRKDYKPKAGDVVIFPSKSPIYHCSTEVTEGEKYMIRTYWSTYQEPDDEWNAGVMQYGEEK